MPNREKEMPPKTIRAAMSIHAKTGLRDGHEGTHRVEVHAP